MDFLNRIVSFNIKHMDRPITIKKLKKIIIKMKDSWLLPHRQKSLMVLAFGQYPLFNFFSFI